METSDTDYFLEESEAEIDIENTKFRSSSNSNNNYKCDFKDCGEYFRRRDAFDRHMFQHNNIKNYSCTINGCNKSYTNNSHLKRHLKTHKDTIKCKGKQCTLEFENETEMLEHYENIHVLVKPFVCTICSEAFRRKHLLKYHMYKHTKEYPYNCTLCEKGFITFGHLVRHEKTHKQQICRICTQKFVKWSDLVAHQKLSHQRQFKCNDCDKIFNLKSGLKHHQEVHLSKDDREIYQCSYEKCPKFYFSLNNLNFHIKRKHEKVIKFICTFNDCGRELSSKQNLDVHMKFHLESSRKIIRKKSQQAKRKDKGIPKISTASKIAGVKNLPEVEKMLISGLTEEITINPCHVELIKNGSEQESDDCENENRKLTRKDQVEITVVGSSITCRQSAVSNSNIIPSINNEIK